jgi:hypothetical protein
MDRNPVAVDLGLQGGGAHGAFTWGVLDRLLEERWLMFDGVSGTSAGAMNAVVMAAALAEGGPPRAREALERFWKRVSNAALRHRVGCLCESALCLCANLRCASTVFTAHSPAIYCGAFASVAVFSVCGATMRSHLRFRVFPPLLTPLGDRCRRAHPHRSRLGRSTAIPTGWSLSTDNRSPDQR